MKKDEYIKRYGLEKFKEKRAKDREYNFVHKEEKKKWYAEHREERAIKSKKYQQEHKEELKEKRKAYFKKYNKQYNKTQRGKAHNLAKAYRRNDILLYGFDISNNVDGKWIVDNIFSGQKCVYCGDQEWTHLGCDRIDNNKPHTADNVVCSCFICNAARENKFSIDEFKKYRSLHPRECDMPKKPLDLLNENGALKKRPI